jgi:hypothetical protein
MDNQNSEINEAPPINRFLVWAVYFMGAILILLFIGLIVGIIYKIKHRVIVPDGTGQIELGLPMDAQAREATVAGDKLTINTGSEVFVIDISSRKVLLRVKVGGP